MDRPTSPSTAVLAILCALLPGCERPPAPRQPAPASGGVPAPGASAALPPGELSLEDRYLELRTLFDSLPAVFRDEPGRSVEDLARDVESGVAKAEGILEEDGGTGGNVLSLDGSERGEVEFMLAHLLHVGFNRAVAARRAEGLELSGRALDLVRAAAIDLEEGSPFREECPLLAGRLYLKRAAFQGDGETRRGDLASARECLGDFLLARPDWPERYSLHLGIADSFLLAGDYPAARDALEAALAAPARIPGAFYLEEKLFDALTGCGDLEAMEALVLRRLSGYPDFLGDRDLGPREKDAMEQWLDVADFWLGHIRYALGDIAGARESFQRQIERVDREEELRAARGEKVGDVARIFRDLRSRRMLSFLDEKQGTRPSLDFDFGDLWCTAGRTTLAGSGGKVVAAAFRNPGDGRSADFLRSLDGLWRRDRARGLEAVVAGFLWGGSTPAEQVQAMVADLGRLGVGIPAGFDPGTSDPAIFRSMGAIVGSPSFIAFDRAGRIAWFLPDPRPMDAGIAARVIERLLAEPSP